MLLSPLVCAKPSAKAVDNPLRFSRSGGRLLLPLFPHLSRHRDWHPGDDLARELVHRVPIHREAVLQAVRLLSRFAPPADVLVGRSRRYVRRGCGTSTARLVVVLSRLRV